MVLGAGLEDRAPGSRCQHKVACVQALDGLSIRTSHMGTQSLVEVGPLHSKTKSLGCLWFSNSQDNGHSSFPQTSVLLGPVSTISA